MQKSVAQCSQVSVQSCDVLLSSLQNSGTLTGPLQLILTASSCYSSCPRRIAIGVTVSRCRNNRPFSRVEQIILDSCICICKFLCLCMTEINLQALRHGRVKKIEFVRSGLGPKQWGMVGCETTRRHVFSNSRIGSMVF